MRWQGSRWLSTALPGNACALLPYPSLRRQTWGHAVSRQLVALGHGQTLHATSGGQHVSQQGGPESLGWWRDVRHGTAKEAAQREPAEAVWGCFTQPVAFSTAYGRPCVLQHSHASCCRRHLVTAADACKVRPTAALLVPWPTLASRRVGAARNLTVRQVRPFCPRGACPPHVKATCQGWRCCLLPPPLVGHTAQPCMRAPAQGDAHVVDLGQQPHLEKAWASHTHPRWGNTTPSVCCLKHTCMPSALAARGTASLPGRCAAAAVPGTAGGGRAHGACRAPQGRSARSMDIKVSDSTHGLAAHGFLSGVSSMLHP